MRKIRETISYNNSEHKKSIKTLSQNKYKTNIYI